MANLGGGALQEESPEQKLSQLLGDALEQAVKEKISSFGGLITREAAVQLLCQENGISTEKKMQLSDARASMLPFSFSARVDRVFPVQQFPGGTMRTVRLHISDKSGEATLVLWNEQAKFLDGGIFAGDEIECSGAYVRAGEISIGRNGSIARAGGSRALQVSELKEGMCNAQGAVEKVEGMRSYTDRRSGEKKQMLSFSLCSGGKCCRAVWWSPPDDAPKLRKGGQVALEGATFRKGELHLNSFSRVLAQGAARGKAGEFIGVAFEGDDVIIKIDKEKFRASIADALAIFRISPASGVLPTTLLSIKAGALAGRQASYSAEGGRLSSLEFES